MTVNMEVGLDYWLPWDTLVSESGKERAAQNHTSKNEAVRPTCVLDIPWYQQEEGHLKLPGPSPPIAETKWSSGTQWGRREEGMLKLRDGVREQEDSLFSCLFCSQKRISIPRNNSTGCCCMIFQNIISISKPSTHRSKFEAEERLTEPGGRECNN